jgi:hypothetical protein
MCEWPSLAKAPLVLRSSLLRRMDPFEAKLRQLPRKYARTRYMQNRVNPLFFSKIHCILTTEAYNQALCTKSFTGHLGQLRFLESPNVAIPRGRKAFLK